MLGTILTMPTVTSLFLSMEPAEYADGGWRDGYGYFTRMDLVQLHTHIAI
jgi:hypothetical protein